MLDDTAGEGGGTDVAAVQLHIGRHELVGDDVGLLYGELRGARALSSRQPRQVMEGGLAQGVDVGVRVQLVAQQRLHRLQDLLHAQ